MEEDERGFTSELWGKLAEQGWLGLIFPERYGGVGLGFLDLTVLLEEMGRALLPGPFFSTVVLGGMAIMDAGNEAQKREFLTGIATGREIVTLALTEPSDRWDDVGVQTTATAKGDSYLISGTKLFVPNANVADYLTVAARTGESDKDVTMIIVPRNADGISRTALKTIAADKQSELVFDDVAVPTSAVLGDVNRGWDTIAKVVQWGAVCKCSEMVGGAQQVLDMTVEYAKQRTQFGRPIGSFQAIQHHCANMATDVEGSRNITYQAAWHLSEGLPAQNEVAMAKAWGSDAYRRVCALGHQCHGAIGFTKEHNMQLYSHRAKAAELGFGDSALHLEAVARAIGL